MKAGEIDKRKMSLLIAAALAVILLILLIAVGIKGCIADDEKQIKTTDQVQREYRADPDSETMQVTVYAYCPCAICNTEKWKGKVSTGQKIKDILARGNNIAAADPDVIPLGTTIEYNGVEYLVADTGGNIKGKTINILKDNHKDAYNFGVRYNQTIRIKK